MPDWLTFIEQLIIPALLSVAVNVNVTVSDDWFAKSAGAVKVIGPGTVLSLETVTVFPSVKDVNPT